MAEEVTDVNDVLPEHLGDAPVEPTTPAEPSTEETKTEEVKEESSADEAEAEDTETKTEEEEAEAEPTEEAKPRSAEARKETLNNEIRDLVSKRNVLRDEVAQANAKVYQPQTAEELIEAGEDPAMARVQALEQRQQMAEYNAQVTDLNANLSIESLQVLSDFTWANPEAPEYDAATAQRAAAYYQKIAGIRTDEQTGLIISANVLPYDTYKAFDETRQSAAQSGQVKGQKSAEKMLANADSPSSAAPKAPPVDNFLIGLRGESTN